jgi:peroxiredoxin
MKKQLVTTALTIILISFISFAQCATIIVQMKAVKESKEGYTLSLSNSFGQYTRTDSVYTSQNGRFELKLNPGVYTLTGYNPWSQKTTYYVYVDNADDQLSINVYLKPLIIPKNITKVQLVGDFNKYEMKDVISFQFDEKLKEMVIPANKIPTGIKKFLVIINDSIWTPLPYLKHEKVLWDGGFVNVFEKGPIRFKPSEFSINDKIQSPDYTTTGQDFNEICQLITQNTKLLQDSANRMRTSVNKNKDLDPSVLMEGYKSYYARFEGSLADLKSKYGTKYGQFLIEIELQLLNNCPAKLLQNLYYTRKNQTKAQEVEKTEDFVNTIKQKALLIKSIDKKSYQLSGSFVNELSMLDYYCENLDIYEQISLPIGYFKQFREDVLKETPNQNIKVTLLLDKARNLSYRNADKAYELYKSIKKDYPQNRMVKDGTIDTYMKGLAVKKGVKAPEFSVKTLDNKEIKLSDYKGKYVFIDFWGTWCGPCKGEIPNVKKLNEVLGGEQLVVIGLMRDNETDAKKYIEQEKIPYANAIASDELMSSYGVNSYPTTFLINKEGVIIAKNLRGGDLTDQVKNEIKE